MAQERKILMNMKLTPAPDIHLDDKNYLMNRDPGMVRQEAVVDGYVRHWDEYIPKNYDPERKYPLMVSVHGGGGNDLGRKFAWHLLAERDGMIVCFPESMSNQNMWNAFAPEDRENEKPDEAVFLNWLRDHMIETYSIDTQRIYIHGQSAGDQMVSDYLRLNADKYTAACPTSGTLFAANIYNDDGTEKVPHMTAIPVSRLHGMDDDNGNTDLRPEYKDYLVSSGEWRRVKMQAVAQPNIYSWRKINQCYELPHITVKGEFNVVRYPSAIDCDTVYISIEGAEHNQRPEFVDNIWSYFLSAFRRVNGRIVKGESIRKFEEDKDTAVFANSSPWAYINNRLVRMSAPARLMNGRRISKYNMYVPYDFIPEALNCEMSVSDDGLSVTYRKNDIQVQIAAGLRGCIVNETIKYIPLVEYLEGMLFVPIAEIAKYLCGMRCLENHEVAYITRGDGILTYDTAMIIRQILRVEAELEPAQFVANQRNYYMGTMMGMPKKPLFPDSADKKPEV